MLSIRLSRVGKKNNPQYRVVVLDKRKDPFAKYLELLGYYHPKTKQIELNAERISYWISVGAQPSDTVHNLLVKQNILKADPKKIKVRPARLKKAEEEKKEAAPAGGEDAPNEEAATAEETEKKEETPKEEQA